MCEILAPAGDEAAFFAALHSGADAVYLGLQNFSARAGAANFTAERLAQLIRTAHMLGVRVHVALNTLVKERELPAFFASAEEAWNAGADALIVQDLFLGAALKRRCPRLVLHLSTQAGVCNVYGARQAKRCGFSRVILARETPFAEIAAIAGEIETEVFVQGALCTCVSGQCYLSSFAGGNSGNRGLCKQPCRKRYTVDRKGFEEPSFALSLADLCVGERVKELAAAGVASFKIEGRMRSAAYVGAAVQYYRDILGGAGGAALSADLSDLKRAYNRGDYTAGYAFGEGKDLHARMVQGHVGERVGTLARFSKNEKFAYIRSAFRPREGDGFKLLRAGREVGGAAWRSSFGVDAGGFFLPAERGWQVGDEVRLTLDNALAERIGARRRAAAVGLSCRFAAGAAPEIIARGRFGERRFVAEFFAERARSSPLTEEEVRRCFSRTDGLPLSVTFDRVEVGEGVFVVRSSLNAFRRAVFACIAEALAGGSRPAVSLVREPRPASSLAGGAHTHASLAGGSRAAGSAATEQPKGESAAGSAAAELPERALCNAVGGGGIAVIDDDFSSPCYERHRIGHAVFKPTDYKNKAQISEFLQISKYYAWHTWLYLPAFVTGAELALIELYAAEFYGIFGEGVWSAQFCKERGLRLFAGTGWNLFNGIAASGAYAEGAERLALSKELSAAEFSETGVQGAFVLTGGGVKVMDLAHCPFGRDCISCDRRRAYMMTDEAGRKFPLLRYETSVCRFELYNAALLSVPAAEGCGRLFDFTALSAEEKETFLAGCGGGLPHTAGAYKRGVN